MSTEGKDAQKESFVRALCGWWLSLEEISINIIPGVNMGIRFAGVATQKGEEESKEVSRMRSSPA